MALISACLTSLKDRDQCALQGSLVLDLARSSRGAAKVGNLGMNLRKYPARPKKDLIWVTDDCRLDSGQDWRTCILYGSGLTISADATCPKYMISVIANWHLSKLQ